MHFAKIYSNFGSRLETSGLHVPFSSGKAHLCIALCLFYPSRSEHYLLIARFLCLAQTSIQIEKQADFFSYMSLGEEKRCTQWRKFPLKKHAYQIQKIYANRSTQRRNILSSLKYDESSNPQESPTFREGGIFRSTSPL